MGEKVKKITSYFEALKPTEKIEVIQPNCSKIRQQQGWWGEIQAGQEKGLGVAGDGRGGNFGAVKGGGVDNYGPVNF